MTRPDIVIPVRVGDENPELRYCLRAIAAHIPHRHVWLVGHRPPWATGVRHIPTDQLRKSKWQNTRMNRAAACAHPEVSERFLLFNDDFFALRTIDRMPVVHRGPVDELVDRQSLRIGGRPNSYIDGARATAQWLRTRHGIDLPLSYEAHVPMPVEKRRLAAVLALAEQSGLDIPHIRTIYGNLHELGGGQVDDVKVSDLDTVPDEDAVFVSTTDRTFRHGAIGRWLRARFSESGPYEIEEVAA